MFYIYILLFVFLIYLIYLIEKTLFSPATIVAVTWCLFPAIACTGVLGLYGISWITHIYILLATASFMIAYSIFSRQRLYSLNTREAEIEYDNINDDYVNYILLIIINIVITMWLMTRYQSTLTIIQNRGFAYLRGISNENFSSNTLINIVYQWFAKPFVIASSAILSIDFFSGRKKLQIPLAICVVINILLDTFLFAARATIVKVMLYFFFSFFFCKKRKYSKKQIFLIILLIVMLMIVVVYMTDERMTGLYSTFSFTDSISMYYIAPFGLLNYYVENPEFSMLTLDGLTYGSAGLGFLYNIFRSFLYIVFRFPYNGSDYIIQLVTQQSVRVGELVRINSAYTAAYIFLRDFGFIGLIIGFAVFGYVIAKCKYNYDYKPTIRSGAIYVFMLYVIFRLAMSYDFLSPSSFFALLFIVLCTHRPKVKLSVKSNK